MKELQFIYLQLFFKEYIEKSFDLSSCFSDISKNNSNLIRFNTYDTNKITREILDLKHSLTTPNNSIQLLNEIIFTKILIMLNEYTKNGDFYLKDNSITNTKILDIISYINENLYNDITIDSIASYFSLNRSYLMHLFKKETGYSIYKYITEKRLFKAKELISNGYNLTEACYLVGFKNYSSFYRAFKDRYNTSPKILFK